MVNLLVSFTISWVRVLVFCFLFSFFSSFPSVWFLRKWTKRNERSVTPIYLRWNNSSFGLWWIWERREPWWKRNLQTLVNLLVPFTFSWMRVLVFCLFFFCSFSSVWLLRKWTKWNERWVTPIYLCWNNFSFWLQWIRERQEPWWRRNLQTLVSLLVPFAFS